MVLLMVIMVVLRIIVRIENISGEEIVSSGAKMLLLDFQCPIFLVHLCFLSLCVFKMDKQCVFVVSFNAQ